MREKDQKNFQKENKNSDTLFREIQRATDGLFYVSETDAPVLAFRGTQVDQLRRDTIIHQLDLKPEPKVEETPFETFFDRLTAVKEWFGETQTAKAKKFLELRKLLEENLRDLTVFRIGEIRLDIYAVGIDEDGVLMGVTTKAVET